MEANPQIFGPMLPQVPLRHYCQNMRRSGEVPGHLELRAAGLLFRVHIMLYAVEDEQLGVINFYRMENPLESLCEELFDSLDAEEEAVLDGLSRLDESTDNHTDTDNEHGMCSAAALAEALLTSRGRVLHIVIHERGAYSR